MPEGTPDKNSELEALKLKEKYLEVINTFATVLFDAQSIHEIVWAAAKLAIAKLNYYDCVIYLFDKECGKLIQSAAYGPKNPQDEFIKEPIKIAPGEGIVGKVFSSGIGEIVNDTTKDPRYIIDDEQRFSEITVPLSYKGEIVGVIDSEHPDKNFFNEQDFKMLTTVAAMVSTKLAQAKANQELLNYQENLEELINEKTLELKQQNQEKEILIKEIHHRVKNNMQIMISLLNLQINTSDSPDEQKKLREFQDRIRSMAIIHERLYLEDDISHITMDEYITQLSNSLLASFQSNNNIQIETEIEAIRMHIDYAIPLGLIINEMITNSLKHAFHFGEEGTISLSLSQIDEQIVFRMSDNGAGFKNNSDESKSSFGTDLIEVLVNQIGGKLTLKSDKGVAYEITFTPEQS
ncbi:MAG: histidine kinase dimerization/phosphoacceptor domain -containing protein [Crocinitomicaceae bacterium]